MVGTTRLLGTHSLPAIEQSRPGITKGFASLTPLVGMPSESDATGFHRTWSGPSARPRDVEPLYRGAVNRTDAATAREPPKRRGL